MPLKHLAAADDDGWDAYHFIRNRVLFELRGRSGYDRTHPDEHGAGHFSLLYSLGTLPVGTVRLDLTTERPSLGTVRLVAVIPEYQRQGFGTLMLRELELFAVARRLRELKVHAAPEAVPFYKKLGWQPMVALPDRTVMTKALA